MRQRQVRILYFIFFKSTVTYLNANADLGMQGKGHDEGRVKEVLHLTVRDKEKG